MYFLFLPKIKHLNVYCNRGDAPHSSEMLTGRHSSETRSRPLPVPENILHGKARK